jgi:hypothetical protein
MRGKVGMKPEAKTRTRQVGEQARQDKARETSKSKRKKR